MVLDTVGYTLLQSEFELTEQGFMQTFASEADAKLALKDSEYVDPNG